MESSSTYTVEPEDDESITVPFTNFLSDDLIGTTYLSPL